MPLSCQYRKIIHSEIDSIASDCQEWWGKNGATIGHGGRAGFKHKRPRAGQFPVRASFRHCGRPFSCAAVEAPWIRLFPFPCCVCSCRRPATSKASASASILWSNASTRNSPAGSGCKPCAGRPAIIPPTTRSKTRFPKRRNATSSSPFFARGSARNCRKAFRAWRRAKPIPAAPPMRC